MKDDKSYQIKRKKMKNMEEQKNLEKEAVLETVISKAVQMPGVKVNRDKFLTEMFARENVAIQEIIDL